MTYNALGRSISDHAVPVWSTNASEFNMEALRIVTGSHTMSSIDKLYSETEMLQAEDHLNRISAPETLFTIHIYTVLPSWQSLRKIHPRIFTPQL